MKPLHWLLVGVGVIVLLGTSAYLFTHKTKTTQNYTAQSQQQAQTTSVKQPIACDVYTFYIAQEVLGAGTKQGENTAPTTQGNTKVSTCTYTDGSNNPKTMQVSTVLLRSSTDNSSIDAYTKAKPADAVHLDGFGDDAYWAPTLGQLNVIKGKTWVIISSGTSKASARTPDQAKQVGVLILGDL